MIFLIFNGGHARQNTKAIGGYHLEAALRGFGKDWTRKLLADRGDALIEL